MGLQKSSISQNESPYGCHRFEHWYRDNSVYFITARCRNRYPAFRTDAAKEIFWTKFDQYTREYDFVPWITSLIDNHYHVLGYLRSGKHLPHMMRKLHGSVAKLVNDTLDTRLRPFWYDTGKQAYFDGCLRDETQAHRTYRYILHQGTRHGLARPGEPYIHTRIAIEKDRAIRRATEVKAFLREVPYKRYDG